MDFTTMTVEELEARRAQIGVEAEQDGADLDALEAEIKGIKAELEARKEAAAKKAEIRTAVATGAGSVIAEAPQTPIPTEERKMFKIDSIEYRDAWTKKIIGRELNEEERAALGAAGAVIPTMTVNAVWDKLTGPADLLGKVDVSQFPTYVRFPKATTKAAATGQAVGGPITESSDVIGYIDLIPNEYVKLLTVGADIDHMAVSAVHDWIVNNLVESIRAEINKDIVVGTGTNELKGILASVTADSTAIPATVTKASLLKIMGALGSNYQGGAVWIMTPAMFYENVMTLTQLNDYIINDGFNFKLFGHDVVLMSELLVSAKETILYGDPKAYKLNVLKALEVKPFETATTTNIQFRGATMADGELIDAAAFVRFAQA
jgi:HK97 family phage major capsid protein